VNVVVAAGYLWEPERFWKSSLRAVLRLAQSAQGVEAGVVR
jgi:hypothetical protein